MQPYFPPIFIDTHRITRIQEFLPEIDRHYQEAAKIHHIPGYSFGILLDGKLIYTGSGGSIDLNKQTPPTTQSMFRIASMTKSFIALAILMLRDEERLRLDDHAHLYVPEIQHLRLTQEDPAITIRDLLIHSAGFPTDDPWADRKMDESKAQFSDLLKSGLYFSNPIGSAFEYSNLGYTILGQIIERISGMPYDLFIDQRILQPLSMNEASWEYKKVPDEKLAKGYRWLDEEWKPEELLSHGVFGAIGGLIVSIDSFSRYAALYQQAWPPRNDPDTGFVKRSTLREMQQPMIFRELSAKHQFSDGREFAFGSLYGYGLGCMCDTLGRTYVGHSGGLPGFGSNWYIMPEYGLGVILLANVTYAPAAKINVELLDTLLSKTQLKPWHLPPSKVLEDRKQALLKILPQWQDTKNTEIFSDNFFLDYPIHVLKKEAKALFEKVGNIVSVSETSPLNQLRGSFIMIGDKGKLQVTLALSPEHIPRIQQFQIKEV